MQPAQGTGWTLSAGGAGAMVGITLLPGKQVQVSSTIVARGGHKVTWSVTNSSGATEHVEICDFLLKNAGDPTRPIKDTPVDGNQATIDFGSIPDGATEVRTTKMKASKAGYPGAWVYKYTLVVGGTVIDPELVVEWP
jgi:hypothetical protein